MANQWRCMECDSRIDEGQMLEAENPFEKGETIFGCPVCKTIGNFTQICDVMGCEAEATCGTPTPIGYRRTCGFHVPTPTGLPLVKE